MKRVIYDRSRFTRSRTFYVRVAAERPRVISQFGVISHKTVVKCALADSDRLHKGERERER